MEEIGLTKEDVQERVIERMCDKLMGELCPADDEEPQGRSIFLRTKLDAEIKDRIDEAVVALADKHVLPGVTAMIEDLTLQETNSWGEKTGKKTTFVEYLVQRAEAYMTEKVNYEGKSQNETRGYSWTGTQTRITHMVHEHLHYSIETAMKQALKDANSSICKGIEEAVKIKLAEALQGLKTTVQTK